MKGQERNWGLRGVEGYLHSHVGLCQVELAIKLPQLPRCAVPGIKLAIKLPRCAVPRIKLAIKLSRCAVTGIKLATRLPCWSVPGGKTSCGTPRPSILDWPQTCMFSAHMPRHICECGASGKSHYFPENAFMSRQQIWKGQEL